MTGKAEYLPTLSSGPKKLVGYKRRASNNVTCARQNLASDLVLDHSKYLTILC